MNHRVKKVVGNETRLFYFNHAWQCLEERIGGVVDLTYTWGLRYIDDLVCRDKGAERLYSIADPNWNVVAITNASGVVQERIAYSTFGKANWLDVNFGTKTASGYGWSRTFTGQVLDSETGLMLYRNRFYHPSLGRFVTRDPIGYEAEDVNLYRYVKNALQQRLDTYGLDGGATLACIGIGTGIICTYYCSGCKAGDVRVGFRTVSCSVKCKEKATGKVNTRSGSKMQGRDEICERNFAGRGTWYPQPGARWRDKGPCSARCLYRETQV